MLQKQARLLEFSQPISCSPLLLQCGISDNASGTSRAWVPTTDRTLISRCDDENVRCRTYSRTQSCYNIEMMQEVKFVHLDKEGIRAPTRKGFPSPTAYPR